MDALTLLQQQHEEVDQLIEEIELAEDAETKRDAFAELADSVAAHAKIEETLFYPTVRAKGAEEQIEEALEEHQEVKTIIADMLKLDVENDQFVTKLGALKKALQHHAHEEEEGKLFPQVRKLMAKDDLEELGEELEQLFEEIIDEDPRNDVPAEAGEAQP